VDLETGLIMKDGKILWECANENIIWYKKWISTDSRWADRITRLDLIKERMQILNTYFNEKLSKANEIPEIKSGTTLHLLHPFNRYVFGHIYDTFQKLQIVDKNQFPINSILLSRTNEIIDFEKHLKVFDLDKKMLFRSNGGLVKVNYLLFVQPVGHPTSFTPESYDFIRNKYRNYYGLSSIEEEPNLKIFLTRRKGAFRRYLLNDDEIHESLKKYGVLYFDGTQTFDEIFHAFSKASHVAGVHGSLFTNNIFGHSKTRYKEYCPEAREVHTFHHQYKVCNSYEHVLVKGDPENNINIDLDDLLNFYK
jgi:capsular polysaccharide biosynthesis protein